MACIRRSVGNEKLYRAWTYLWDTYKENGGLPQAESDAVDVLRDCYISTLGEQCS